MLLFFRILCDFKMSRRPSLFCFIPDCPFNSIPIASPSVFRMHFIILHHLSFHGVTDWYSVPGVEREVRRPTRNEYILAGHVWNRRTLSESQIQFLLEAGRLVWLNV